MIRPRPPAQLLSSEHDADNLSHIRFLPAIEIVEWAAETFIAEGAPLLNEDHAHLRFAVIGALWTNVPNSRAGRGIVGQAEFLKNAGGSRGKWGRAREQQQIEEWFGCVPDFLLTFDAGYAAACSDEEFCALLEHELYHCGQELDEFGAPRFTAGGLPAFGMRAHDVEEFVGVVRRYGSQAAHVGAMIEAASKPPEIAPVSIAAACGNCLMPRLVRSA
jgi:hypothetical protein